MRDDSGTKRNPHILIVDCEPSVLAYTKALLEVANYSVEVAGNSEEAIKRVHGKPAIDLMLVEIAMPGINGLRIIELCRKFRPQQRIIVLSHISDIKAVVQAMKL